MRSPAVLFLVSILMILPTSVIAAGADKAWVEERLDTLNELYVHLHRNPELSYHEVETAKRIADELRKAGAEVTEDVGGTGLVGLLKNGEGPTILVRTDLDALPVAEATGLPYASEVSTTDDDGKTVGVMHACGHDIHMTCLVGTAQWLNAHRDVWSGTVVLIGQPAEERVGGARSMLKAGLYERWPRPDFALALHVAADAPAGVVAYCAGPALASVASVDLLIRGKGGHGAYPHRTVDPIVLSAALIMDLQTIVSREVAPTDPAVVTVGSIHGGAKHNIIPPEVRLQLTLRSYKSEVMDQLIDGIRRRTEALARAHQAPEPTIELGEQTPATVNDPELVDQVVPALKAAIGDANVIATDPVMGAEDFGLYSLDGEIPSFMFWLGAEPMTKYEAARNGGEPLPSLHSPLFGPDPRPTISTGIQAMTAAIVELAKPGGPASER